DVMMPRMDGIAVLRVLKADPETRFVPVVLMTALNSVEDRVRGIEAGADDFLSKPVDDRELLARITTALAMKRTIDPPIGELRDANSHLQRFGTRQRDVAVSAVEWRAQDTGVPHEAVRFLARARKSAAEELVRERGGVPAEHAAGPLVAVFDGPDPEVRLVA